MTKKHKKNNKKIPVIVGIIITLLLIGILLIIFLKPKKIDYHYAHDAVKEYLTYNDQKVFLYNLDELKIKLDKKDVSLEEYLKDNSLDDLFKEVENNLILKKELKDGGTKIYETKNKKVFGDNLVIIACQTTDGNKDVYFGPNLDYLKALKDGGCGKNFFEDKEFTRVYTIKIVKKVKDDLYSLTISDGTKEVVIERTLSKESKSIIKAGKSYIFYFNNKYGELIKEDITEIFDKCELTGVVPEE